LFRFGRLAIEMGFVIANDRNQPRNQGRDGKFWLEYSKSYQPNSSKGGRLWRPHCEMREIKTMIKVTHDFKTPVRRKFTSIVGVRSRPLPAWKRSEKALGDGQFQLLGPFQAAAIERQAYKSAAERDLRSATFWA